MSGAAVANVAPKVVQLATTAVAVSELASLGGGLIQALFGMDARGLQKMIEKHGEDNWRVRIWKGLGVVADGADHVNHTMDRVTETMDRTRNVGTTASKRVNRVMESINQAGSAFQKTFSMPELIPIPVSA